MTERETNTEFMERLLTWGCPTGALVHPFVLTALEKYAAQCLNAGAEAFDSDLLSGEAWVRTAAFVKAEVDKHLGAA